MGNESAVDFLVQMYKIMAVFTNLQVDISFASVNQRKEASGFVFFLFREL